MWKKILWIIIFSFGICHAKYGQNKKYNLDASMFFLHSSDELKPLWLTANEWGVFSKYGQSEGLFNLGVNYQLVKNDFLSLKAGLRGVFNADVGESFLQEAYLNGNLWFVDFSIGKEQFSPVMYDDGLTSGLYLMNSNASPVPRVTIGVFEYMPLDFVNNWIEIKGGVSQGWLNDDRGTKANSAENILLHEKFAYMRLGNTKVRPYAGLIHSALFGGSRPDGTNIPVDFLATFKGDASVKLGETNATGAHMGLWDFGFSWNADFGKLNFYFQKPFADASGMKLWNRYDKDYIVGILIYPQKIKWLKGISVEVIKTDHQSGYGIPDPIYPTDYNDHKKGEIIWMDDIEDDFDSFMFEVFGEIQTGWTEDEVIRYLEVELDEGHKYGGRDDYMNNGEYYAGWTYHGVAMGTPLYHTASTVRKYAAPWNETDRVFFYNNRVNGIHLGGEGIISDQVSFRLKGTFTINKGTYGEEFTNRYSWDREDNYYFADSKNQMYTMAELRWDIKQLNGVKVKGVLAYDFGQLYNSVGGRVGITYSPDL